jgi:uncharacterized protein YuzE
MRLLYDHEADALTIKLADGIVDRTVEVDSGTLVDLDAAGCVLTIEVIHPGRRWPLAEVLARFPIDPDDAKMLQGMWTGDKQLELTEVAPLAVA